MIQFPADNSLAELKTFSPALDIDFYHSDSELRDDKRVRKDLKEATEVLSMRSSRMGAVSFLLGDENGLISDPVGLLCLLTQVFLLLLVSSYFA